MPRDRGQGETPEELARDDESKHLLEQGGLPVTATRRIAEAKESGGTWSSDLSVAELAAVRAVGFDPVGLVMGTSIYRVSYQVTQGFGTGPGWISQSTLYGTRWRPTGYENFPCLHGYYHEGMADGFNWENETYAKAMSAARELAMERMEAEAKALGAHGVVGLRVHEQRGGEYGGHVEFFAVGTAIVRRGRPPVPQLFTSHLSGQDFAKLMRIGYVPAAFVAGVAAIQVQPGCMMEWQERMIQNAEIEQITAAGVRARRQAVQRLEEHVARHGHGVVGVESRVRSHSVGGAAELIEVQLTGTAIRRFASEPMPAEPLRMLRLGTPA